MTHPAAYVKTDENQSPLYGKCCEKDYSFTALALQAGKSAVVAESKPHSGFSDGNNR